LKTIYRHRIGPILLPDTDPYGADTAWADNFVALNEALDTWEQMHAASMKSAHLLDSDYFNEDLNKRVGFIFKLARKRAFLRRRGCSQQSTFATFTTTVTR
jgi:hypothetical protein